MSFAPASLVLPAVASTLKTARWKSSESSVIVAATARGLVTVVDLAKPATTPMGIRIGGAAALAVNPVASLVYVAPEWGRRDGQLITLLRIGTSLQEVSSLTRRFLRRWPLLSQPFGDFSKPFRSTSIQT